MKCNECGMKNNTHKLDCSRRYRQDEVDLWVNSWGVGVTGDGCGSGSESSHGHCSSESPTDSSSC